MKLGMEMTYEEEERIKLLSPDEIEAEISELLKNVHGSSELKDHMRGRLIQFYEHPERYFNVPNV